MVVGLDPSLIVLDGDPAPLPKKGHSPPIFGLCLWWPTSWMDQDATWYDGRSRPGQHCVRCGPSSTPPRGTATQISANVCCGQTAGWITFTMLLGIKVGLGPGHIVLHWDPVPPKRAQPPPQFSARVYCGQMVTHLSCCQELVVWFLAAD